MSDVRARSWYSFGRPLAAIRADTVPVTRLAARNTKSRVVARPLLYLRRQHGRH